MNKTKLIMKAKRLLSGFVATAIAASMLPTLPAMAEETTEKYPYTLFAGSSKEGAITVNAGNFCVNGNVATNGTIVSSGNMNINGTKTEKVGEETIYILKKLNYTYFSGDNVDVYPDDYSYPEINININDPMAVQGELELTGNINLNTGIKALEDVNLNGEVKNTNSSVICSETGDIVIDSTNINLNGLIYAPYGDVEITAQNLNLNNVIIIADTITFNCPSINVNYSSSMAEFIGTESAFSVELYAFGEYNSEMHSIDIEWCTNYTNGLCEIYISDNNIDYTSVGSVSDATSYQYLITEDFEKMFFKVALITNSDNVIESIPFIVTNNINEYIVDFLDSDNDKLTDIFEIKCGTNINVKDTDSDGLTDYQEIYLTNTNPLVYNSVVDDLADANADSDKDQLSNIEEITQGTNPLIVDTDGDMLSDYDEINIFFTDPLLQDTDGDTVVDCDEATLGLSPTNPETFGIPDAEYTIKQSIDCDNKALSQINGEGQPYSLSIDIESSGVAENNIKISQSSVSGSMFAYGVMGIMPEISYNTDLTVKDMTLHFSIDNSYIPKYDAQNEFDVDYGIYNSELNGIKRLNVFKYSEKMHAMLPIETVVDEANNTLTVTNATVGTYCVMDMVWWLRSFGIAPEDFIYDEQEEVALYSTMYTSLDVENTIQDIDPEIYGYVSTNKNDSESTYEVTAYSINFYDEASMIMLADSSEYVEKYDLVDIVFVLQANGIQADMFELQKQTIIELGQRVFSHLPKSRIKILQCTSANNYIDLGWFDNYEKLSENVNGITYTVNTTDYINTGLSTAYYDALYDTDYRDGAIKFPIWTWNTWHSDNGIEPFVFNNSYEFYELILGNNVLYQNGKGLFIYNSNGFVNQNLTNSTITSNVLFDYIYDKCNIVNGDLVSYQIMSSTGIKNVALEPINIYSDTDFDEDGITDYNEIISELIEWNESGDIEKLPSFEECLNYYGDSYSRQALKRYLGSYPSAAYNALEAMLYGKPILPIHSNPMAFDTDLDGYSDKEEKNNNTDPFMFNLLFSIDDITTLSGNYYYSTTCKEEYDESDLQWFLVATGNNLFGANHDYSKIYKDGLLTYFAENNDALNKMSESVEAVNTWSNIISQLAACTEVGLTSLTDYEFDKLSNVYLRLNQYSRQLNSIKYNPSMSTTISKISSECIQNIYTTTIKANNIANKINIQNAVAVNVKKFAGDGATKLCRVLYVGLGFVDAASDAIILNAISTTMQENVDVIKYVMMYSDYETQSFAAAELLGSLENEGYQALDTAFTFITTTANYGIDGEVRIKFAATCPLATTIVAGVAFSDLAFNVSGTSKNIVSTVGTAMMGNILGEKLLNELEIREYDIYRDRYYPVYEENIEHTLMLFSNLAYSRIQGENEVADQMKSYTWAFQYYMSKLWGIDCTEAAINCSQTVLDIRIMLSDYAN